jgi:hypothetical protein
MVHTNSILVTEYYLELHPYQQAIEDGKQAAIEKAKKEALAIAQKKAIEDANRAQIQASSLPTNAENSEGLRPGVNAKDGPPREETGSGSNDPTGPPQNGQIMTSGPTDTGTTSTQPQAAEAPPTEDPNAQNPEKKDTEPEERGKVVGTCQMFSCAMGKWFYQILRVEELRGPDYDFEMSFPADSQIVLTFGGPVCEYSEVILLSILKISVVLPKSNVLIFLDCFYGPSTKYVIRVSIFQ